MKKRLLPLLLALALVLCISPVAAEEDLFFLALNDTLPAASPQLTPTQSGGWIYVPATVFNNRVSGVNFGIFYGFSDDGTELIFYNLSGMTLTFDLAANTATTSTGEPVMPGRVLWSGGNCYVPAYAICTYFGLSYAYYNTQYGPLLRITDGNARLSDAAFLSSAESLMRARYNAAHTSPPAQPAPPEPAAPTPTPPSSSPSSSSAPYTGGGTPAPQTSPAAPDQGPEEEPVKTFSLSLGLRANSDVTASLDALASVNAAAVLFFQADTLNSQADQIRQAAGRGHRVGLVPVGETSQARLESIRAGSRDLARILRQETWFVLSGDQALAEAGYLLWTPTATLPAGDAGTVYQAIYDAGTSRSAPTRLLAGTDQALAPLLQRLAQDGDTFLAIRETNY